jgi:multidrug efflux pump subunit AcrB
VKALERAIDRPLPILLAALLVVSLGFWCLARLPINRTPGVEIPFAMVFAPYVGAAPDAVETEITIELEEQLNTLENLHHLTSVSSEGLSTHFIQFKDRADMTESVRDVRDKVDLAQVEFPAEADLAVVRELSFDDEPIIFFTLSGGGDLYALRDLAEGLEPLLESVPGVASVDIFGGFEREVRIHADPRVLAQYDLTQAGLADTIRRQSRNVPAGELRTDSTQKLIRATGEFRDLEEIRAIAVASEPSGLLSLRDVATVELTHERRTSGAWRGREPSVTLIARRRADVDTVETVRMLRERIETLRERLPPGVRIDANADSSKDIGHMLSQLGRSALFGLALVAVVLFVMFGARQALLVSSVVPFALLFTMIGLYILDMEISNIALFALILVLGLVVDGAIIVGEAIYAEREAGASPKAAAKAGIARVGLPVIAADLTTIAAFLPMLMMVGVMGQFMSVLPKVVIFALVGSVFVDHLLLPAAAARVPGRRRSRRGPLAPDGLPWFSAELPRARRAYLRMLERALSRRRTVLGSAAAAFVAALLLFATDRISSIFLPTVDMGRFSLDYELPRGSGLEETNRVGRLLAREVETLPELESYVITTGDTGALDSEGRRGGRVGAEYGRISVELVSRSQRDRGLAEIVAETRERTTRFAGLSIHFEQPEEGPPTGAALAVQVKGDRLEELARVAEEAEKRVAALPGATDVRVDYDRDKPEIRVDLDRPRAAARHGISPDQISAALSTAFRGVEVGRMWMDGERVDLRLQAPKTYTHTLDNVRELPLRSADGGLVPLGEVASVGLSMAHNAVFRHDTLRTITVRADAVEGHSSVELEADARKALATMALPAAVRIDFGGESEERDRSYASLWSALKWGVLLIYVIIAVQFNSLLQPLIVLASIPLSIVGVTMGLLVTGTPFSFMVFIGIVSLTGIVVNDSIVMIDAINRKRRAGMSAEEAIRDASLQRFRPVLLTTVTTIAGLLPLTVGVAEGGEFWQPLGVTIISGLLVASLLTLFIVPVLYSLLTGPRRSRRTIRERVRHPVETPAGAASLQPGA